MDRKTSSFAANKDSRSIAYPDYYVEVRRMSQVYHQFMEITFYCQVKLHLFDVSSSMGSKHESFLSFLCDYSGNLY